MNTPLGKNKFRWTSYFIDNFDLLYSKNDIRHEGIVISPFGITAIAKMPISISQINSKANHQNLTKSGLAWQRDKTGLEKSLIAQSSIYQRPRRIE